MKLEIALAYSNHLRDGTAGFRREFCKRLGIKNLLTISK